MKSLLLIPVTLLLCAVTAFGAETAPPSPGALIPENPALPPNPSAGPLVRGQRVFSTGHSFHFGFPPLLQEIAQSAGFKDHIAIGVSSIGGSRVAAHFGPQTTANKALTAGTVDVLMTTPIYLPDAGIEQFSQLGAEHNTNFRLLMMEFWLPFDNYEPRNYTHGPVGSPTEHIKPPVVDHNAANAEGLRQIHQRYFAEMDEHVSVINKKLGRPVVCVVPVGQAVIALREKIRVGQTPGLKAQWDLFTDQLGHPKMPLTILMGYCHYAVIYRKNPIGLPVPKALGMGQQTEALNRLLQELAWEAVLHHPLSGVKVEPTPVVTTP